MLDFTAVAVLELSHAIEAEHALEQRRRKWRGRLREIRRADRAAARRALAAGRDELPVVENPPRWN